jgi:YD repeat-containing protein
MNKICWPLILLALMTHGTFGQTRGLPMYGSFEKGSFDTVNRQDLNTTFSIGIIAGNGRGQVFNFAISYNSLFWTHPVSSNAWSSALNAADAPSFGWSTVSAIGGVSVKITTSLACEYRSGSIEIPEYATTWSNYAFTEPDGTVHPFSASYTIEPAQCSGGDFGTKSGYATDGSGFYLNNGTSVQSPSGISFSGGNNQTDTNGNFISSVTNSNETDWTDTAGRLVLKVITNPTNIEYEYQDTAGTYQVVTLNLQNYNIKTNFGCSGVVDYTSSSAIALPASITYPNGNQYTFTYEPTSGNTPYVTGRIQEVTLPTGGSVTYAQTGPNDGINCSDGTGLGLTRAIFDGSNTWSWAFARAANGSNWVTTVTAPQMPYDSAPNQSIFTFNSTGQETQEQLYQGNAYGSALRTINTTWASNGSPATKITILEDAKTESEIETNYDAYGNLDTLEEFDYGNGAPGANLRTTNYTYSSAYATQNILDRVLTKTVEDSTGTVQYREVTAYDGTAISPCPTGSPQHNDTAYACSFTARGNPTSITTYTNASAGTGPVSKNSYYDFFGNLVQADQNCCVTKSWNFSATTNYSSPDSVVRGSASGVHTTANFTYSPYTGQVLSIEDPNNQTTRYSYDSMRRLTVSTRPDSAQIIDSYNDSSHTSSHSDPVQGSSVKKQVEALDGLGRTSEVSVVDGSGNLYSTTQTEYDGLERSYNLSNPFTSSPQYWTETVYDALGRVTKTVLPDNSSTSYVYSAASITTTDPAGHQSKGQSDGIGRLTTVYEPDPTNGNSLTLQTNYTYTVLDKLASAIQGSQTRSFSYDGMGRLSSQSLPESGTTSFQYNSYDLISQRTDARGVITSYTYDTMNRLYQITYNIGTSGVAATPTVTYSYGANAALFNNGRELTLTDGLGTISYLYDNLGRATQTQHVINGSTYNIGYQYNLAGAVTALTYPSGRVVQQSYDSIGRLSSIASGSTTYVSNFVYNSASGYTNFAMGNGVAVTLGYSPDRLQLQSMQYSGSSIVYSVAYGYSQNGGNNGQITSAVDNVDSGRSTVYTYDALNRLTSAVTTGSTTYPKWGLSFTYDRYGNRTAQSVTAGTANANSIVVNASTNHITTAGYAYDLNGNLTSDAVNSIAYDAGNRLISSSGTGGSGAYSYRASNLRTVKASGGVNTVYIFDGNRDIAEYQNGSLANEYVYLGNKPVASYLSGTLYYHVADQDSIRVHLDSSGNIVGQRGHYPFGEDWYTSTLLNRHFTTYERDSESSNDNATPRFYVSRVGRFAVHANTPGGGARPQSNNLYSYFFNDTLKHSGPLDDPGCNPEDPYCIPVGGAPPGGGGGGGTYCTVFQIETAECPNDPDPNPPTTPPLCTADLFYRPVAHTFGLANHAFWYIVDENGQNHVISAGPPPGFTIFRLGKLDIFEFNGTESKRFAADNIFTANQWRPQVTSESTCYNTDDMQFYIDTFPNNIINYKILGPNSNSVAHYLGKMAFLAPTAPPRTVGWNVSIWGFGLF